MYTLVDFITHIKGVEYIMSIMAIGGFLLFWEVLKPAPFRTLVSTGKQDIEYIKQKGYGDAMKSLGKIAAAPFIGIDYLVMLPIGLAAALMIGGTNLMLNGLSSILRENMLFDWRPNGGVLFRKKEERNRRKCKIAVLVYLL